MDTQPMAHKGDTLAQRWAALEPHLVRYGPRDDSRPLVLLFHGCGGLRPHLQWYGQAAADAGCEAVVVDSYAARRFSRAFALALVCSGVVLKGRERAGDVLAAAWGLLDQGRGERPVVMGGWSHGSWSIMDLMTMTLDAPGDAGLADPDPRALRNLKGVFLAYPYGGVGALSRVKPWLRAPQVLAVAPMLDHVTSPKDAGRCFEKPRAAVSAFELWAPRATHAFDEPTGIYPMRHDPELTRESLQRFTVFLNAALPAD